MPKGDHDKAKKEFSEWMKYIPDDYSITRLTLPGTHDSHATKENTPELMQLLAVCQFHNVTRQLELGVRYLDLRVGDPSLSMVHGYVTLSGHLSDVLGEIREFLRTHSTETVLVSIKWDDPKDTHDQSLRDFVWNAWERNGWYKQKTWPDLKTARGKAILLRRFDSEGKDEMGIDCMGFYGSKSAGEKAAAPWLQIDNPAEAGIPFENRWNRALLNLNHARSQPSSDGILYISNLADTGIQKGENPPIAYAANVNWRLRQYLSSDNSQVDPEKNRLGLVILDFIRYGDTARIISKNWKQNVYATSANPSWKGNGPAVADFSSTKEAVTIFIQTDGNLVVYAKNGLDARWASMTNMTPGDNKRLSFQDDGNLVIYENGDGRWGLDRFARNSRLRVMHGPPFFMVDSDLLKTDLYWTPGGDILTEPNLDYSANTNFIKMYLAYATNPGGAAQQGMSQLYRAGFDYVSGTLRKDNNPVANGLATAIDAVGNWYAYTGNVTVQVLEFVTTPGRKIVGWFSSLFG